MAEPSECWLPGAYSGECECGDSNRDGKNEWLYVEPSGIVDGATKCTQDQLNSNTRYPFNLTPTPKPGFNQIVGWAENTTKELVDEYGGEAVGIALGATAAYIAGKKIKKTFQNWWKPKHEEY